MKRRHLVAWSANLLFMFMVLFGMAFPDLLANTLIVMSFSGLGLWAVMTIQDQERSRIEGFGARFSLPSLIVAMILGFFVVKESSGVWFWLFVICTLMPIYCSFFPAAWALWKRLDEQPFTQ